MTNECQTNEEREKGKEVMDEPTVEGKKIPEWEVFAKKEALEIRKKKENAGNMAKLAKVTERITNRVSYNKADGLLKNFKDPKEGPKIDMCGVGEDDYKDLLVKMFTPNKEDDQEAAYLLIDKYGAETISGIADNLRDIALVVKDQWLTHGVISLKSITGRAHEVRSDQKLYNTFNDSKKK